MCSLMPHAVPFGACFVKKDTVACCIHYKAWQDAVIYGFLAFSKGHFDFFLLLLSKFRCFYGAVFVFEKLVPRWNFTVCSSVLSPFFYKKRMKYLFIYLWVTCCMFHATYQKTAMQGCMCYRYCYLMLSPMLSLGEQVKLIHIDLQLSQFFQLYLQLET